MPITGTEIQSYIETRLGITVNSDLVLEAINECLNEIGDAGLLYDTIDLTVTDTEERYNLPLEPSPYTKVQLVLKLVDGEEYIYQRWDYRNGSIRIFDEGDYTIVCRKMAEPISNIADTITGLHRLYNNAIKYYTLAWIRENDNIEDVGAQVLYQRFEKSVARAAQTLANTKAPTKVRVIRHA